jgi:hypothetical protein
MKARKITKANCKVLIVKKAKNKTINKPLQREKQIKYKS